MADTRLVEIVYAHDPDTDGPDLSKIGTVVELSKVAARSMVNSGEGRYADVPRNDLGLPLADMNRRQVMAHAQGLGIAVPADMSKSDILAAIEQHQNAAEEQAAEDELSRLTKAELQVRLDELNADLAEPVEVPSNAKKDDLIAAVRQAQDAANAPDPAAEPSGDGEAPIVTVLPGADANPNNDAITDQP